MTQWMRLYTEALHDPKVQTLPAELFKTWINLLLVAAEHDGNLPVNTELTYLLRRRSDHLQRDLNTLVKLGLLDITENGLSPHNWLKRQYKSDNSTERSRQHRRRKCNVASTVAATPPDNRVQNTEKKEVASQPMRTRKTGDFPDNGFEVFYGEYPHKVGRKAAERAFEKVERSGEVTFANLMAGLRRYIASKPHDIQWKNPATFLNSGCWADEPNFIATGPPRQPVGNGYAQVFRELSGLDNDRTSNIQANIGTISPQLRPYSGVDQVSDLLWNDRHSNWNET